MHMKPVLFTILFALLIFTGCATTSIPTQGRTFIDLQNGIFQIAGSDLMWQKDRSPLLESGEEVLSYVENLDLGGYTDWRLPTPDEILQLHNVIDFGTAKEGDYGISLKGNYWCAIDSGEVMAGSWQDGASCEITRSYYPHLKGHVRAVRP